MTMDTKLLDEFFACTHFSGPLPELKDFRSEIYALAYCRITSYLQTMAYKGINPMIAIQMALAGEIGGE